MSSILSPLIALVNALLGSIGNITYKKATEVSTIGRDAFLQIGNIFGLVIVIVLVAMTPGILTWIDFFQLLFAIGIMLLGYWNGNSVQTLYKTEKMSTLQTLGNFSTAVSLIASYFIFWGVSVYTLCIAVLAIVIVVYSQRVPGHGFEFPREIKKAFFIYAVTAANGILIIYAIKYIGSMGYFALSTVVTTLFVSIVMAAIVPNGHKDMLNGTKEFYMYRCTACFSGQISRLLAFYLISSIGPVLSTLFGLLGNIITLVLGILILKEYPTKKEWIVSILLSVMIAAGYLLK